MNYFKKRRSAFGFAWKGLLHFFKYEAHGKIHLLAFVAVIIAGFYFKITASEWMFVFLASALVFVCEIFNSALERLVDIVHPGEHEAAGLVKDLCAASVLVASVFAFFTAVIIFYPHVIH